MGTPTRITAILLFFSAALLCLSQCQTLENRTALAKDLAEKWAQTIKNRTTFYKDLAKKRMLKIANRTAFAEDLAEEETPSTENPTSLAEDLAQKSVLTVANPMIFAKDLSEEQTPSTENRSGLVKDLAGKWLPTIQNRTAFAKDLAKKRMQTIANRKAFFKDLAKKSILKIANRTASADDLAEKETPSTENPTNLANDLAQKRVLSIANPTILAKDLSEEQTPSTENRTGLVKDLSEKWVPTIQNRTAFAKDLVKKRMETIANRKAFFKDLAKKSILKIANRTAPADDLAEEETPSANPTNLANDLAQKRTLSIANPTIFAKTLSEEQTPSTENRTTFAKDLAKKWVLTAEKRAKLAELWPKYGPDYSLFEKTAEEYPCGPLPRSASVPTSVHALRPGDIKVIGAMGDSLTAGSGITASNIFAVLVQNRGLSWSGGGQTDYADQITLPNILKKYNPDVYGYATGNGDEKSKTSIFNVAVTGSTSSDLVNQARVMIDRMKADPNVDFENDWKVVTILSGNNDLCDYCSEPETLNSDKFFANTVAALDILHAELPRTLVNLVEPLNMEIVTELNKGLICSTLHFFLCDCAAFPDNAEKERELVREADMFQLAAEEIATSGRYDTRDDFTVVSQPFFNGTYLPRMADGQPDMSYFAPDCFHLSRKGQAAAASALWNNMIERVSGKRTAWTPGEKIECPTEDQPYFFTNKNSQPSSQNLLQQQPQLAPQQSTAAAGSSSSSTVAAVLGVAVLAAVAVVAVVVFRRKRRRHSYSAINSSGLYEFTG